MDAVVLGAVLTLALVGAVKLSYLALAALLDGMLGPIRSEIHSETRHETEVPQPAPVALQ